MDAKIKNNEILKVPLLSLALFGFIQFQDQRCKLLHKLLAYIVIILYVWYTISLVIFLNINNFKVELVFNNGCALSMYFTIWMKGLVSMVFRKEYASLFERMNNSMKQIENEGDEEMKQILQNLVKKSKRITWGMQIMMMFTVFVFEIYLFALTFIYYVQVLNSNCSLSLLLKIVKRVKKIF